MRIITDGKLYAIQKGWIFKKYLSLYCKTEWYTFEESLNYCWGNKERVKNLYDSLNRKRNIKPISNDEID